MGVWGPGPSDNDDAADWLAEMEQTKDPTLIGETLRSLLQEARPSLRSGARAIVAAQVLSALVGAGYDDLSESLSEWLEEVNWVPTSELIASAIDAIAKTEGNDSELSNIWQGNHFIEVYGGTYEAWLEVNDRIRAYLSEHLDVPGAK